MTRTDPGWAPGRNEKEAREDLHEKYGIPREIDGVKVRVVVLRSDQAVLFGRVLTQDPRVNCHAPRCFRIRPVGMDYCPPHERQANQAPRSPEGHQAGEPT